MDRKDLGGWIARYERVWRTPGTEALAELFTADASYRNGPYAEASRGLAEIAALWEAGREGPDEPFEISAEPVAVEGAVGVARVEVAYGDPVVQEYRELWVVTLDEDGLCSSFEEWPYWPEGSSGEWPRR